MAWTTLTFSFGSVLTSSKMTNLYNNFAAMAAGDSGAPSIVEAALAAAVSAQLVTNGDSHDHSGGDGAALVAGSYTAGSVDQSAVGASAIGQGELKTTTSDQTASLGANTTASLALTGADYTIHYGIAIQSGVIAEADLHWRAGGYAGSYTYNIGFRNNDGASAVTYYVRSRYVQASPPYRLADVVPLFVFVLIDNSTKEIVGTSIAEDPPWAYHGRTNIMAKFYDDQGNGYRYEKEWIVDMLIGNGPNPLAMFAAGQKRAALELIRNKSAPVLMEVTNDIKNRDMDYYPHPFAGHDLTNKTIAMLNPYDNFVLELLDIKQQSDISISKLLHDGDVIVNPLQTIDTMSPQGVIICNGGWR